MQPTRTFGGFTIGEWTLILAGVLLLANLPVIALTGSFVLWTGAKGVFALGVVFFFLDI